MRIFGTLSILLALVLGTACTSKTAEPVKPTVGASCEHLGSSDGAFACEGDKVIFCSVLTKNKWEVAQDMFQCKAGKTCTEIGDNKTSCQ